MEKYYYLIIDVWDGSAFVNDTTGYIFMRTPSSVSDPYDYLPRVNDFAVVFEMENKELILLNL